MAKKPAILILGAPGSGKGTQGVTLGKLPKFFHCACGDVFRALDVRTELGKKFVEYSSKGMLVPDEFTIDLWKAQIDNWRDSRMYFPDSDILLLDGIPRNVAQAKMLEDYIDVHQVFHLSCPDRNELVRRMRKRAIHSNRIDDASEEVIQDRIKTYEAETKPLIEYYDDAIITEIDATQEPIEVLNAMINKIISLPIFEEMKKVEI